MLRNSGFNLTTTRRLPPLLSGFLVALCLSIIPLMGTSGVAKADFRVCNTTDSVIGVALGYRAKAGWITEGWWHIDAEKCKTLVQGDLQSRYYYIYAEDADRGGRWTGDINMCVAEKEFKIVGFNDCFARGFQRVGFQEHDTGEQQNWMVQLTSDMIAPASQ